jgi:hypothetical protein
LSVQFVSFGYYRCLSVRYVFEIPHMVPFTQVAYATHIHAVPIVPGNPPNTYLVPGVCTLTVLHVLLMGSDSQVPLVGSHTRGRVTLVINYPPVRYLAML